MLHSDGMIWDPSLEPCGKDAASGKRGGWVGYVSRHDIASIWVAFFHECQQSSDSVASDSVASDSVADRSASRPDRRPARKRPPTAPTAPR